MLVPLLGALVYFVAYSDSDWAQTVYVLVKVYTVAWPALATVLILREPIPRPDLSAPHHRRAVPAGLALGALMSGIGLALMASPLGSSLEAYSPQIRLKVTQLGVLDHYLLFGFFLAFIHSAIEEYYWRWFVFGTLRRLMSRRPAAVLAGLAFASHHFVILGQYFSPAWTVLLGAGVAAGGTAWCLLFERQRTLVGVWCSHVLVDLAVLWVGYRMLF